MGYAELVARKDALKAKVMADSEASRIAHEIAVRMWASSISPLGNARRQGEIVDLIKQYERRSAELLNTLEDT